MSNETIPAPLENLQRLVNKLEQQLSSILSRVDLQQILALAIEIRQRPATILMGVGKSGLIADKIAATLSSMGCRSLAVHPVEAQHGDLGCIQSADLVLFLSKSGESDELLGLFPPLRRRGVRLWAMTENQASRLAASVDRCLLIPHVQELDPHDMIPTTSSMAQLLIGDLLAMAVLDAKGLTLEQFHANHPAGRIGKRLHLRVEDLMIPLSQTPQAREADTILQLLAPLSSGRSGCVVLVDREGNCTGIFTDGDLRRALEKGGPSVLESRVGDWACREPRCIAGVALAAEAMHQMEADRTRPISVMPVLEGPRLIGLLRLHDCIQAGI